MYAYDLHYICMFRMIRSYAKKKNNITYALHYHFTLSPYVKKEIISHLLYLIILNLGSNSRCACDPCLHTLCMYVIYMTHDLYDKSRIPCSRYICIWFTLHMHACTHACAHACMHTCIDRETYTNSLSHNTERGKAS